MDEDESSESGIISGLAKHVNSIAQVCDLLVLAGLGWLPLNASYFKN
jgi:hypothetical protein